MPTAQTRTERRRHVSPPHIQNYNTDTLLRPAESLTAPLSRYPAHLWYHSCVSFRTFHDCCILRLHVYAVISLLSGNDDLLLFVLVDKLPLTDVLLLLAFFGCHPHVRVILLLSWGMLVMAARVQTWVELAHDRTVGEFAVRCSAVRSVPAWWC
jgi:hypothetical protein